MKIKPKNSKKEGGERHINFYHKKLNILNNLYKFMIFTKTNFTKFKGVEWSVNEKFLKNSFLRGGMKWGMTPSNTVYSNVKFFIFKKYKLELVKYNL